MNKLELVQALRREVSAAGGNSTGETPASTIDQTGEYGLLVRRIDEAWTQLQQNYKWSFLWESVLVPISTGNNFQSGSIPAHRYLQNKGRINETGAKLQYYPWDYFDDKYPQAQIKPGDTPSAWTVAPDMAIHINVKPVTTSVILNMHRYKNPVQLGADDAAVPALPAEHHMLIVWEAAMAVHKHDVAGAEYRAAKDSRDTKLMALGMLELPQWTFGQPLLLS